MGISRSWEVDASARRKSLSTLYGTPSRPGALSVLLSATMLLMSAGVARAATLSLRCQVDKFYDRI